MAKASSALRSRFLPSPWPQSLRADLLAGLLGAVLVLPQGIAFATLAGLPPQYGLYSSVVPCIVAALAGSSRHVVSGPTNANSLALFAMLAPLAAVGSPAYIELALAVTVLVGLLQFATGALRLGAIANFISPTALLGFTAGAAGLIAVHALKDALGLALPPGPSAADVLRAALTQAPRPGALLVAVVTLGAAAGLRQWRRGSPFMLIALAAGTLLAWALERWAPPAWQLRVLGPLPSPLPPFHLPGVQVAQLPQLLGIAAALTVVALAQSIAIAKAVAARSGQRIDANREFLGQGLSNLVGGLFSCYVSCGSLNRSMPNLEAGARSPLAAVFSALLLIPLVALTAPVLAHIPYAAIAGLLVLVGWTLLDLPRWKRLARASRQELAVALITLAATLTLRLEIAVLIGSALSLGLYLHRTSRPAMRTMGFNRDRADAHRPFVVVAHTPDALPECPQLKLLRMEGSVYFGATAHVANQLQALRDRPRPQKHLLVMAKSMNFIDVAGADLWRQELHARRALGGDLYFHRPRPPVLAQWRRDGFLDELGADHIFPDKRRAIAAITHRLDCDTCRRCTVRVFQECAELPGPGCTRD
ncbi:SulP family inorganic anion transporter [Azohydromonas caseinilytica]|uniref:SulP family inorganic anion transporter n=1 Tax=Azohydromonas caseinilytica TaxID=2728836 RepID=A0A848FEJ6_9BURK|nr:SulP family inorganic anion transporter [Azohydromonas caseinilytica]NML17834.1 SulP family inorganic anion transporter [Azohydromonas caseinilytica]